jgi:hypothetical protein
VIVPVNRGPLSAERPFPGPYAYREEDARDGYFRGRAAEAKELLRLIRRNPLTLLFGASGLGKSSLICAGLFPELRRRGHLPVRIKLSYDLGSNGDGRRDLSRQIMADVRQAAGSAGIEAENGDDRDTLWEFFQELELWGPGPSLITPVIVLDQFEEAFTLGGQSGVARAAVTLLFEGLADLIENRMPVTVTAGRGPGNLTLVSGERPPLVRIVLSLREEYLPNLEVLRSAMPSIAHGRMRLEAFNGQQAAHVIMGSAPHLLPSHVAEAIVRAVAGARARLLRNQVGSLSPGMYRWSEPLLERLWPGTSRRPQVRWDTPEIAERSLAELVIEPALLNLFCYQLNERRLTHTPHVPAIIDAGLVEAASANILNDFYASCMKGLGADARNFVENRLLSPAGFRLPIPEGEASGAMRRGESTISLLVDRRLIRRETRQDTTYLLLVHDVLARPIIEARTRRRGRRRYVIVAVGTAVTVVMVMAASKLLELLPPVRDARRELEESRVELARLQETLNDERQRAEVDLDRSANERDQAKREARDAQAQMQLAHEQMQFALDAQRRAALEVERLKQAAAHQVAELDRARNEERKAEEMRAQLAEQARQLELRRRRLEVLNDQLEKRQGIPNALGE